MEEKNKTLSNAQILKVLGISKTSLKKLRGVLVNEGKLVKGREISEAFLVSTIIPALNLKKSRKGSISWEDALSISSSSSFRKAKMLYDKVFREDYGSLAYKYSCQNLGEENYERFLQLSVEMVDIIKNNNAIDPEPIVELLNNIFDQVANILAYQVFAQNELKLQPTSMPTE